MPFRGACALMTRPEAARLFQVARVRFDDEGRVDAALVTETDARTNRPMSAEELPVSEVVELIHSGHVVSPLHTPAREHASRHRFVVVCHAGFESIDIVGPPDSAFGLFDLAEPGRPRHR